MPDSRDSTAMQRIARTTCSALLAAIAAVFPGSAAGSEPCYFSQIDGGYPNCGIQLDGTPHCWGQYASTMASPPAGVFTSVSAGTKHACGIRADSSVECWGDVCGVYYGCYRGYCTFYSQCTPYSDSYLPPAGSFSQVSAGGTHDCGLRPDGTLECWGGNPMVPGPPPSGTFTRIEAATMGSCAIDTTGEMHCWGVPQNGSTTPPAPDTVPPIDEFTDLDGGALFYCTLRAGAAECWGYNYYGQATPTPGSYVQLSASETNACGLHADGTVTCWGYDVHGESSPPSGSFVQISGNCGLHADGTAECWGPGGGLVECATCGNGVLANAEECDDGNLVDDDGCDSNCTVTACGNGILNAGEICDDGNLVDHDGCGHDCTISLACGDGEWDIGEWCDDGNSVNGDGCENDCTLTPPVCGDGEKESPEACDDGNSVTNDGCENDCTISPPDCGNSILTDDEECDDGNEIPGDGCDALCDEECPQSLPDPGFELHPASTSSISIVDRDDDEKDSLKWKWRGLFDYADLPGVETARYQLCLYPDDGSVGGAVKLRGPAGWERHNKYLDPQLVRGSIKKLSLGIRLYRESRFSLTAGGIDLPDGILPTSSYTIALCDALLGNCWTASFPSGELDGGRFSARFPE